MEIQRRILKCLEQEGRQSTSKIASSVAAEYYYVLKVLNLLTSQGYVHKQPETHRVYWSLTTKGELHASTVADASSSRKRGKKHG